MSFMNTLFFGRNFVSVSFALYGNVCAGNKQLVNALFDDLTRIWKRSDKNNNVAINEAGIFMPTFLEFQEKKNTGRNIPGYAGDTACTPRFLSGFYKRSGGR